MEEIGIRIRGRKAIDDVETVDAIVDKIYISAGKVGDTIEHRFLILDASNDPATGVAGNCTTTCYDESHANDDADNPCNVTELGATGAYYYAFTPNAAGTWSVLVECSNPNSAQLFVFKVA